MTISYAHLLAVDTDDQRLQSIALPLEINGWYAITIHHDAATAFYQLSARAYDLILIDVTLAIADNCAFLRRLQNNPRLNAMPVLLLAEVAQMESVTAGLEAGATDYILTPTTPALLKSRLSIHLQQREVRAQALSCLQAFNDMKKLADDLRDVILPLGITLSTEKDFDRLLETILVEAKKICHADGGTLYLRTPDKQLRFAIVRTDSLSLAYGGSMERTIPFAPLPLFDPATNQPNQSNVATYVALKGESVNIPDIYATDGFDFSGAKKFDQQFKYRTISCLTVPLKNDEVIGILQLINAKSPSDDHIIPFTMYHKLVAESLASQAAIVLHNHVLRQRHEALIQAERELQIGRKVQAEFLPADIPQPPGWEIAFHFEPSREVAGDFYDAFDLPQSKIALVIGDVCDKGVAAAIFMAQIRSLLRAFMQQHYYLDEQCGNTAVTPTPLDSANPPTNGFRPVDAAALLDTVMLTNVHVGSNHSHTNMFVTLFMLTLNPQTGDFIYVNSGHLPPLILGAAGIRRRLMPTGPAVGLMAGARFELGYGRLQPGEILLAYTDGVTEARNVTGALFGDERLAGTAIERPLSAANLLHHILNNVYHHVGLAGQFDDITLMAIHYKQPSEQTDRESG